jgi:hypothetical protein
MIETENGSVAFATTGNKALDFFTRITRGAELCDYIPSFVEIYNEDPNLALKVLCNLRDFRNGKGEKIIPRVLLFVVKYIDNKVYEKIILQFINDYGCWKDLLFICEFSNSFGMKNSFEISLFADQLLNDLYEISDKPVQIETVSFFNKWKNVIFGENKPTDDIKIKKISLAGKWAPTEGCHYDKAPLKLAHAIRHKMRMTAKDYRKSLGKLREKINVLERNMCENTFENIIFNEIPGAAHTNYRKALKRETNCKEESSISRKELSSRYREYLIDLQNGKETIKSSGLHPHTIVKYYTELSEVDEVLESQWKNIVNKVKSKGTFSQALAIVDVSGSMGGEPMMASMALGLIVAECTSGPFNNKVISFHEKPTWEHIPDDTLLSKVNKIKNMKWGGSTNIHAVFDMILEHAIRSNLDPDQMIETIFIFTDMQFDQCFSSHKTNFECIKEHYNENGYDLPKIICWNLRTSSSKTLPFEQHQDGVASLSGFSTELLQSVLDGEDINPMTVFMKIMDKYNVIGKNIDNAENYHLDIPYCFIEAMENILKK